MSKDHNDSIYFYTGLPSSHESPKWHQVWAAKLGRLGYQPVQIYTRRIRYRPKRITLPDGTERLIRVGEEKGIDVRIALDVVDLAHHNEYDVAVIVSQDQDFSEVAAEIRKISKRADRWIRVVSAFPVGSGTSNCRGINGTDWLQIERQMYDACLERTRR